MPLDADCLRAITPRYTSNHAFGSTQGQMIAAIGPVLQQTLSDQGLGTNLRAVHFLAQVCHETMGLAQCVEEASGAAYEGRSDLGNTQPGDGSRYKGRGLFQLTGRTNYASYGAKLGVDLINHPDLAAEPVTSLRIACEFWNGHSLNQYADADDVLAISKIINTGHNGATLPNGLQSRKDYLARAKVALGLGASVPAAAPAGAMPVLRPGDQGPPVAVLQQKLAAAGCRVGIDGDYGPRTETIVRQFQVDNQLEADAIVGEETWRALK